MVQRSSSGSVPKAAKVLATSKTTHFVNAILLQGTTPMLRTPHGKVTENLYSNINTLTPLWRWWWLVANTLRHPAQHSRNISLIEQHKFRRCRCQCWADAVQEWCTMWADWSSLGLEEHGRSGRINTCDPERHSRWSTLTQKIQIMPVSRCCKARCHSTVRLAIAQLSL